jgi:hypothetical protein
MKIVGELWFLPFTEEVNLSGTYLIIEMTAIG